MSEYRQIKPLVIIPGTLSSGGKTKRQSVNLIHIMKNVQDSDSDPEVNRTAHNA